MKFLILFFILLLSITPIILIAYYFYKKDTIKEPKKFLNKLFFMGIISGLVVAIISVEGIILFPKLTNLNHIENYIVLIFYSYIFIALIEETFKFLMIYTGSYNSNEFDQAYDIILYSIFVGLGFAAFENIIYVINNPSFNTILLRNITAVPAHISFQTIMGYYLYLSKSENQKVNIGLGILIPIFLHGTYDLLIFLGSKTLIIIDLFSLGGLFLYSIFKINKLIEIDKKNLSTFCPNNNTKN